MEEMGWFVPLEENTAGLSTEGGDEPIAGAGAGRGNLALPETGSNQRIQKKTCKKKPVTTLQREPASQTQRSKSAGTRNFESLWYELG